MKKRIIVITLALVMMMLSFLTACRQEDAGPAPAVVPPPATGQAAPAPVAPIDATQPADLSFPIVEEPIRLSYFMQMNSAMAATMADYSDVGFFQLREELTNVGIDWIHPTGGNEQFNLMVVGGDFPDLINWPFGNFTGGATALIEGNVIIPLDIELVRRYAPNYMRIMDANPEVFRSTLLDDGTFFQFINFNFDAATDQIVNFNILGPFIRQDWLDIVELPIPTTVAELEQVLIAFRDNENLAALFGNVTPFVVDRTLQGLRVMSGMFGTRFASQGIGNSVHIGPDGNLVFGPTTENFRMFLEYMHRWFNEGLLNPDFAVLPDFHPEILNSRAGFAFGAMGSGLTMGRLALQEINPSYNLVSMPYPIGPMGHRSFLNDRGANPRATAISSQNQHVIESLRWIDFAFSPEGSIASTFGIEGISFNWVDGEPILSGYVMDQPNPHGFNQEEAISRWAMGSVNYPNARDIRFFEQVNLLHDWQVDIQTNWATAVEDIMVPPITMDPDEARRFASIMSDINTHVDEMILRFILGQEPLSNFDNFVGQIERMGINDALAIQEGALARFRGRN